MNFKWRFYSDQNRYIAYHGPYVLKTTSLGSYEVFHDGLKIGFGEKEDDFFDAAERIAIEHAAKSGVGQINAMRAADGLPPVGTQKPSPATKLEHQFLIDLASACNKFTALATPQRQDECYELAEYIARRMYGRTDIPASKMWEVDEYLRLHGPNLEAKTIVGYFNRLVVSRLDSGSAHGREIDAVAEKIKEVVQHNASIAYELNGGIAVSDLARRVRLDPSTATRKQVEDRIDALMREPAELVKHEREKSQRCYDDLAAANRVRELVIEDNNLLRDRLHASEAMVGQLLLDIERLRKTAK